MSTHWFPVSEVADDMAIIDDNNNTPSSVSPSSRLLSRHQQAQHHHHHHHPQPTSPTAAAAVAPLFCSAEEVFSLGSPFQHAPWKMSYSPYSSFSMSPSSSSYLSHRIRNHPQPQQQGSTSSSSRDYKRRQRRHQQQQQQQQQPLSPISTSSSSSSSRRSVLKRSASSGRRRRHRHRRSPSDTTALTEATGVTSSSAEDYEQSTALYPYSCSSLRSDNDDDYKRGTVVDSTTRRVTKYQQELDELQRAMWLVGFNNAHADQDDTNQQQQQQHDAAADQEQSLLDTEPVDELTMITGRGTGTTTTTTVPAKYRHVVPMSAAVETCLHDPHEPSSTPATSSSVQKRSRRRQGASPMTTTTTSPTTASDTTTAPVATPTTPTASFDLCLPLQQRYQKRNNVTPVFHRYRPVGDFVRHDCGTTNKVKFPSSSSSSAMKQDSSVVTPSSHKSSTPAAAVGTRTTTTTTTATSSSSSTTPAAAAPTSPRPLSNYKRHILNKHSSLDKEKDAFTKTKTATTTSTLDRPKMARAISTPPNLATVHSSTTSGSGNTTTNNKSNGATTTITTHATARATAKLAAARRSRSHGSPAATSATATTTTSSTPPPPTTTSTQDLLREIVTPSNTMVGTQYVDSDDLLAVEAMSVVSMHSSRSIASNTPTVRAGTFNTSLDRKTINTSSATKRRVLSPSLPRVDDCDMSMASSMAALSMASNPVSIDECGPIDVDTGEEVDALIDSIAVVSPVYDTAADDSRLLLLDKHDLLEEERFRGLEFPVLDEVEITRGLASYMRGFEPPIVTVIANEQADTVNVSVWFDDDDDDADGKVTDRLTAREMDLLDKHHGEAKRRGGGGGPCIMNMALKPKILSLMCGVPQYHPHHSIDYGTDDDNDMNNHHQHHHRQERGGESFPSLSTSMMGSEIRSADLDSKLTYEV